MVHVARVGWWRPGLGMAAAEGRSEGSLEAGDAAIDDCGTEGGLLCGGGDTRKRRGGDAALLRGEGQECPPRLGAAGYVIFGIEVTGGTPVPLCGGGDKAGTALLRRLLL